MKTDALSERPPAAASMSPAAEAVLTFLQSVGRRSEAELYLRLFRKLPKHSFAIIAAGSPVIQRQLGSLLEQLRFLSELGLPAPIVLGLLDPERAQGNAERLHKRLPAFALTPTLYTFDTPELAARVRTDLESERIPILFFQAHEAGNASDRFRRLGELASELDTRKVVLLRRRGALGPQREQRIELAPGHLIQTRSGGISIINLRSDAEALRAKRVLRKEDADLLERVSDLMGPAPEATLVSVTSPLDLLRELFTVKGAGTLIKCGTSILRAASFESVDAERLKRLLEVSFARTLRPAVFERPTLSIYVEKNYRCAGILEHCPLAPYLSKFAVDPVAQGEGMGNDLWQAIARDHLTLFWRTRASNSISSWYSSLADGVVRLPNWHVFWRGLSPSLVPQLVSEALARPDDFEG